jgi:hypothetical protein
MTSNGGDSFDVILPATPGQLSSFLRAADGTLYAGTRSGKLFVRAPGAASFASMDAPHLRCLGQRPGDTRVYACVDIVADGYSLASTDDQGATFQRVMSFTDLLGPLTCPPVQTNCAAHWSPHPGRPRHQEHERRRHGRNAEERRELRDGRSRGMGALRRRRVPVRAAAAITRLSRAAPRREREPARRRGSRGAAPPLAPPRATRPARRPSVLPPAAWAG